MKLSRRAQLLKPSPTMAMAQKARDLAASGKPVINLTLGEPDWACFKAGVLGAQQALQSGKTKYLPAPGLPDLKVQIARHLQQELGVTYSPQQIVVGSGAKFVIYSLLAMLLDPGDEVIIPTPYWVSYPTMVELAGGTPRIIETTEEQGFKLSASQLEECLKNNPRARTLIICSPNNPTGFAFSKAEIAELAAVVKRFPDLVVISDDIYNQLMFSGDPVAPHLLHHSPELIEQVIPVNGASKIFSMTGLRIGWAAMPTALARVTGDFFSQTTSNASSVSQYAALGAIQDYQTELQDVRAELAARVEIFKGRLSKNSQLRFLNPQGAFYIWLDVRAWLGYLHRPSGQRLTGSADVAKALLESSYLAVVPGIEFGTEGYLRLSIASSRKDLELAIERLNAFATELSKA